MGSSSSAHRSPLSRSDPTKQQKLLGVKTSEFETSKESVTVMTDKKTPLNDSVKTSGGSGSISTIPKPKEPSKPTKAQLERWTSSINSLLSDPDGITAFEKFLKDAESDDGEFTKYLSFYRECNDFKKKMCALKKDAFKIFETYLEVGSDLEIGTDKEGEKVGHKLDEDGFPQEFLFDETQQKVKDILSKTHYINFCLFLKDKFNI